MKLASAFATIMLLSIASTASAEEGMGCAVDVPGGGSFEWGGCSGFWNNGPGATTATFVLSHHLLGDGGSPNVSWSDPRCPNDDYSNLVCHLPVLSGQPRSLTASFSLGSSYYEFSADAFYETGQ